MNKFLKNITLLIMILAFVDAAAQVTLESVLNQNAKGGDIIIIGQTINNTPGISEDGSLDFVPPHELKLNLHTDSDGRYIVDRKLKFVNCTFSEIFILSNFNFQDSLIFERCTFIERVILNNLKSETIYFEDNQIPILTVDSLQIGRFILDGDKVEAWTEISSSTFNRQLSIFMESRFFELKGNTINIPKPKIVLSDSSLFYEGAPTSNSIYVENAKQVSINENVFNGHGPYDIFSCVLPDSEGIEIINNNFQGLLQLVGKADFLTIRGNKIKFIDVYQFSFPEFKSSIEWDNISGNRLANQYSMGVPEGILKLAERQPFYDQMNIANEGDSWLPQFYFGSTQKELMDKWFYNHLSSDYYRIYLTYKSQGRIEDANMAYVEMKDLHGKRLKALFKDNNTLKNFLNWRLNQLMKFYTEHGTQPVKAIVISFYIIILFGVFYFLFPSSWDEFEFNQRKWKTQGFKKTMLLSGKHLINSQILSLNAFVTLGFGNIPTKGIPRYICIFEGFIGWFLLSLFTVALINQTLF